MKVLSIKQPWAAAIIYGGKDIENRTWNTKLRGRFMVHASLAADRNAPDHVWAIFDKYFRDGDLAFGGVIGTVVLRDVVTESQSPWFQGPKGFVLDNPEVCRFIPMKGKLGFFEFKQD